MIYSKIIVGFVTQNYDEKGKCIEQYFTSSDDYDWEDENENQIPDPNFVNIPCEMVNPNVYKFPYQTLNLKDESENNTE